MVKNEFYSQKGGMGKSGADLDHLDLVCTQEVNEEMEDSRYFLNAQNEKIKVNKKEIKMTEEEKEAVKLQLKVQMEQVESQMKLKDKQIKKIQQQVKGEIYTYLYDKNEKKINEKNKKKKEVVFGSNN